RARRPALFVRRGDEISAGVAADGGGRDDLAPRKRAAKSAWTRPTPGLSLPAQGSWGRPMATSEGTRRCALAAAALLASAIAAPPDAREMMRRERDGMGGGGVGTGLAIGIGTGIIVNEINRPAQARPDDRPRPAKPKPTKPRSAGRDDDDGKPRAP